MRTSVFLQLIKNRRMCPRQRSRSPFLFSFLASSGSFSVTYNRIGGDRGHAQRDKILDKQLHSLIEQTSSKTGASRRSCQ
ncbi:hypothetical protein K2173_022366 [Erythroxylum novogranatense]|uniref:Secreted protein n=1 Tax=Erythroxylum novogranatense TaxID=1862640 RepID=A0AAV8THL8_9ROSI|nr:hypothetical protein K2173_022366 [Erythroxylum novogranatense]